MPEKPRQLLPYKSANPTGKNIILFLVWISDENLRSGLLCPMSIPEWIIIFPLTGPVQSIRYTFTVEITKAMVLQPSSAAAAAAAAVDNSITVHSRLCPVGGLSLIRCQ